MAAPAGSEFIVVRHAEKADDDSGALHRVDVDASGRGLLDSGRQAA